MLALALTQQSLPATPVVERGRVGPIAIGPSADEIYEKYRDRVRLVDLKLEGMLSPALELKFGAQVTLAMSFHLDTARHQDLWRDPAAVPRDLRIVAILLTH